MAMAVSPTWTPRESAKPSGFAAAGAAPGSMCTTARSEEGSMPRTSPWTFLPSWPKRTTTLEEEPTTWALVTRVPLPSMRKPVPEPDCVRIETTAGLAFA